jgi:long-subunit fatty acid transport protein
MRLAAFAATFLSAPSASAQAVTPLPQDELDFQGRASLAIGSGARALGMGGAFLARADDATAASWNPAGLSYLRLPEISLVGVSNNSDTLTKRTTGVTNEDSRVRATEPDFIAAAIPFEAGRFSGAVQFSFQRTLSLDAERTIRRQNARIEQDFQGGFDVLALGTGMKVTRSLRVGLTVNHWMNGYRQTRAREGVNPTVQDIDFQLSGWNFNVGVLWSPFENLNLGAVAKTPFTASITLERRRQDSIPLLPSESSFVSDDVRLELPASVGFGASWRPQSPLTISTDYTRTFWSSGRIRNFYTLPIVGPPAPPDTLFDRLNYPAVDEEFQEDTEQFRLGVEYVVVGGPIKVPFRGGFFTDRQYFRNEAGRPPIFFGATLGTGIIVGPLLVDVAFVRETGDYLDRLGNEIDVRIRRFYVSLIYRHSGRR